MTSSRSSDKIKQVVVVRRDTSPPMKMGKAIAQSVHGAQMFLIDKIKSGKKFNSLEEEWLSFGKAVIAVRVDSEKEFFEIFQQAKKAGLEVNMITDSGLTEFKEPTKTCLAIGPDRSSKIDPITGHLKLL